MYSCALYIVANNWQNKKTFYFSGGLEVEVHDMDASQPPTKRVMQVDINQALTGVGVEVRHFYRSQ